MCALQGFILIYSTTEASTFDDVEEFRNIILRAKDADNVPMVLVGNKIDLEDDRQISTAKGKALADEWGCEFMETSAKTVVNVKELFEKIVDLVSKDLGAGAGNGEADGAGKEEDDGKAKKKKKKKGCLIL